MMRFGVLIAAFAVAAIGCSSADEAPIPEPVVVCGLSAAPGVVEFGEVFVGAPRRPLRAVVVENVAPHIASGDVAIEGEGLSVVQGAGPFQLGPGESLKITIAFEPKVVGPHSGVLRIRPGQTLPITANATPPPFRAEPHGAHFGTVEVGRSRVVDVTLVNISGGRLKGDVTTPDAQTFVVLDGWGSYDLADGETLGLRIRFTPAATGPASAQIDVGQGWTLPVWGDGSDVDSGTVMFTESEHLFAGATVGCAIEEQVLLRHTEGGPVTGRLSLFGASDEFSIVGGARGYTMRPAGALAVTVRYEPKSGGTGAVTLSAGNGASVALTAAPATDLVWDPAVTDLGAVYGDESFDVLLTNNGAEDASGVITVEGSEKFSIAEGGGLFYLGPGDSQVVSVVFGHTLFEPRQNSTLLAGSCARASLSAVPNADERLLTVDFDAQLLGTVQLGQSVRRVIELVNGSNARQQGRFTVSGQGFSVVDGNPEFDLAPAERLPLTIAFEPVVEGIVAATLTTNHGSEVMVGAGTAGEPAVVAVDTPVINFGEVPVGQSSTETFTLRHVSGSVAYGIFREDSEAFTVRATRNTGEVLGDSVWTVRPDGAVEFRVTFSPFAVGVIHARAIGPDGLTVLFSGTGVGDAAEPGERCPLIPISFGGERSLQWEATLFGTVRIGTSVRRAFEFENRSDARQSGTVELTGAGFSIVCGDPDYDLEPGDRVSYTVEFAPLVSGPVSGQLTVGEDSVELLAAGSTGDPATVVADTPVIDFGDVIVGQTATRLLQLRHVSGSVAFGNLSESSRAFDLNPFWAVSPQSPAEVIATFTPVTVGNQRTRAVGTNGLSVLLIGNGVPEPAVQWTPSSLAFETTTSDGFDAAGFVLTNISADPASGAVELQADGLVLESGSGPFELAPGAVRCVTVRRSQPGADPTAKGQLTAAGAIAQVTSDAATGSLGSPLTHARGDSSPDAVAFSQSARGCQASGRSESGGVALFWLLLSIAIVGRAQKSRSTTSIR